MQAGSLKLFKQEEPRAEKRKEGLSLEHKWVGGRPFPVTHEVLSLLL